MSRPSYLKVALKKHRKKLLTVGIEPGTSYFTSWYCSKSFQVAVGCFVLLINAIMFISPVVNS